VLARVSEVVIAALLAAITAAATGNLDDRLRRARCDACGMPA
jgi:hypothetical protein